MLSQPENLERNQKLAGALQATQFILFAAYLLTVTIIALAKFVKKANNDSLESQMIQM